MADVENTLNDDNFFGDIVDISKKHPKKEIISVNLSNLARSILKSDEFFGDTVDTLKEGIEQHRKRECLKGVINKGNTYSSGSKLNTRKGGQGHRRNC